MAETTAHNHDHVAGWAEYAAGRIKAAGHRRSSARDEVLAVIAAQECAITARDISSELARNGSEVGIATVYRALELLESMKLVQRVEVGQGVARFEPSMPDGDHHHHLVCETCEELVPFEDEGLERAIDRLAGKLDLKITGHDIVLHGQCSNCAN